MELDLRLKVYICYRQLMWVRKKIITSISCFTQYDITSPHRMLFAFHRMCCTCDAEVSAWVVFIDALDQHLCSSAGSSSCRFNRDCLSIHDWSQKKKEKKKERKKKTRDSRTHGVTTIVFGLNIIPEANEIQTMFVLAALESILFRSQLRIADCAALFRASPY